MTPKMIGTLEAAVITEMGTSFPSVPVITSGQAVPSAVSMYTIFRVIPSDESIPVGMGATARSRNVGVLQLDVLGPKDVGAGPTGDIAEHIGRFLRRRDIEVLGEGLIVTKDHSCVDFGTVKEEHRYIMRCPYRYDYA